MKFIKTDMGKLTVVNNENPDKIRLLYYRFNSPHWINIQITIPMPDGIVRLDCAGDLEPDEERYTIIKLQKAIRSWMGARPDEVFQARVFPIRRRIDKLRKDIRRFGPGTFRDQYLTEALAEIERIKEEHQR